MSGPLQVLALNSGSSSLKFGAYRVDAGRATMRLDGEIEGLGTDGATLHARGPQGEVVHRIAIGRDARDGLDKIAALLRDQGVATPDVVGHRIVHGGAEVRQHCLIDAAVKERLRAACAFAPLHLPPALAALDDAVQRFPGVPQVACVDTAFHAHLDEVARRLPLPHIPATEGLIRYGFHGLSCESIVRSFDGAIPARLVIAHLGNGASVSAVRDGRSIDTTMGLTPAGGLVMGTRSGDLDPGVLMWLMRERGLDIDALDDLVNHRSGLKGVSGGVSDMRALHDGVARGDADAALAVAMFCRSASKHVAGMMAALGGADALVFTGGIGEHDAAVRASICGDLSFAGIVLDGIRDGDSPGLISRDESAVAVQVIASREDEQIALIAAEVVGRG